MDTNRPNYINGKWLSPRIPNGSHNVINPSNEDIIFTLPLSSKLDVDDAVIAANSSFNGIYIIIWVVWSFFWEN